MPTTTLEKPLSIKPPKKEEVLRGFTSTLFKMGENGELVCGREVQKTCQEDVYPSNIWQGLNEQAWLFSLFLKGWGWARGKRARKGSAFRSFQNISFWYFLYREWTISKGLIIQKHGSDLVKGYGHG